MKTFLFISFLIYNFAPAQNYGLQENFENEIVDQRWSTMDLDGDGKTWNLTSANTLTTNLGFSGYTYISDSYDQVNSQSLNPDNVLVSPAFIYESPLLKNPLHLLGISFRISATNPSKFSETYAVYLLPATQTFTGTETPIFFETLNSEIGSKTVYIDNFEYFGQEVKLYFRHYNSENQNALVIDDISNFNNTMSVNDQVFKNSNIIFPNPARSVIYLDLKNEKANTAEVIDAVGRKYDIKLLNNALNIEGLKPGIYYIKINTTRASYVNKFIKE